MIVEDSLKGSSQFFTSEKVYYIFIVGPQWTIRSILKHFCSAENNSNHVFELFCGSCMFLFSAYMSPTLSQIVIVKDIDNEFKEALNQIYR